MKFSFHLYTFLFFLVFNNAEFDRAEKLFNQGKFSQAKPIFESLLHDNPNHAKTIEYLGDIEANAKSWDKAIYYYTLLKKLKPNDANSYYKYGGSVGMKAKSVNKLRALGMIDDIEKSFLKAAQLDKKHIDTRWALVMLYIELPGIVGGSEKKAQKYADELLTISKVDGYMSKGYIDEYFKRYTKAEINYTKAYEIGNSKTTFQKLYNLYLNKLKDTDKAQKLKIQFENKQ